MWATLLDFVWEAAKVIGWIALFLVISIAVFGSMHPGSEYD